MSYYGVLITMPTLHKLYNLSLLSPFIHSLNKYLMNIYYMLDIFLGTWDTSVYKRQKKNLSSLEYILV